MNNPSSPGLSTDQFQRIRDVLAKALPNGPQTILDEGSLTFRHGRFRLFVQTEEYPSERWKFMEGLASAEIELTDEGLKIRLIPDVAQRMIVVATPHGRDPIAYLSTDGSEYSDLVKLLNVDEASLAPTAIVGFAYDDEGDFNQAMDEAKRDFPSVDFSSVKYLA